MNNFIFYNPTRLLFGKGMINQLTQQIPAGFDPLLFIAFPSKIISIYCYNFTAV